MKTTDIKSAFLQGKVIDRDVYLHHLKKLKQEARYGS